MHLNNSDVGGFAGTVLSAESWRGLRKDKYPYTANIERISRED
jgi:hypothetical protein